ERRGRAPGASAADVAVDERAGVRRRDQLDAIVRQDEADPAIPERHLEVAEPLVDGRAIDACEGRDLAPRERPLGDEQERLELALGQLARALVGEAGDAPGGE